MSTIHLLAADLANRCPALAQDSPTNRATVIEGLITEAMQGAVSQELFDAMEANLEKFEHENVKLRAELAAANQRAEKAEGESKEKSENYRQKVEWCERLVAQVNQLRADKEKAEACFEALRKLQDAIQTANCQALGMINQMQGTRR